MSHILPSQNHASFSEESVLFLKGGMDPKVVYLTANISTNSLAQLPKMVYA